jgi:MULE transposase domain
MVCFVLLLPSLFISPLVLSCFLLFNSLLTLYPTTVIIIHDALTPTSIIIAVQADDLPNPHLKPVDAHLLAFKSTPWIGTLPFKGHFCLDTEVFCASSEQTHDLFQYLHSWYKGLKNIVRFNPLMYPITCGFVGKDSGGQKLITDLCQSARSHGNFALASNGNGSRRREQRVLLCSNGRRYCPPSSEKTEAAVAMEGIESESYRVTTYIGDKKNSRGSNSSGEPMKKRSSTLRDTTCTCPARITIRLDENSFFLVCGLGDNQHKGHPPMSHHEITNRKRFLDAGSLEDVSAMAVANIQPSQAALFTKTRTSEIFTRRQMAYVQGFSRMAKDLLDLEDDANLSSGEVSPSDRMLKYLHKSGASYVCLYHNVKTKEVRGNNAKAARIECNIDDNGDHLTSISTDAGEPSRRLLPLEVTETSDFKDYAQQSRHAVGARDDQDILIACCWVLPDARRLFQAFPEVLCVDGTHETNNESRPLLSLSVKDSNGKVTVVVRCFAPNERSWFFRWLFQEALPVLLGRQTLKLVKLVMTDGDAQETAQVDYAISRVFVNAIRTRCGWHLVHQGWKRHVHGLGVRAGKTQAAKLQVKVIQNWLYSWMRRGVHCIEEYEM